MSSIASPRRTEAAPAEAGLRRLTTTLATIFLSVLLISLRPFTPGGEAVEGSGDLVNQLGFGGLGALALVSMLTLVDTRVLAAILSPWWLLVAGFMLLSAFNAADPPSALRAASFTLAGILTMAAVLTLPRDADALATVFVVAGAAVLGLSYAGIFIFPDLARHTAASAEPQHAGLWRGVFSHKNVAGPVTACLGLVGLYIARRGWFWRGGLLFAAAMVFTLQTGSKTTLGLVPAAILTVALPGIVGMRVLTVIIFASALAGMAIGTLGIVFIEPVRHLVLGYFPDLTYTGRTTLWEFAGEMIAQRPWLGYGYESFWGTPLLGSQYQPFDRAWDIRNIVHGHNGYVDIVLTMGFPALVACALAFLVVPLVDYVRTPRLKENILLSDLFLMILLFAGLNAFLESFFLRRADPVWLFVVMAALGLRLTARLPMRSAPPAILDGVAPHTHI
jgi:O-antigen ligase